MGLFYRRKEEGGRKNRRKKAWSDDHAKRLFFMTGDATPLFFLDHRVERKEIGVGFTDAVCLAGKDTGQAQQTAFNRQHAD